MESVGLPKGLIRYASEDEIEKTHILSSLLEWRVTAVLLILIGIILTGFVIFYEQR
jgi:hypothetical protein